MYLPTHHLLRYLHKAIATKRAIPGVLAQALMPLAILVGAYLNPAQAAQILAEFKPALRATAITGFTAPANFGARVPVQSSEFAEPTELAVLSHTIETAGLGETVKPVVSTEPRASANPGNLQSALTVENGPPRQATPAPQSATNTLNDSGETEANAESRLQLKLIAIASAISIPLLLLGIWLARKQDRLQHHSPPAQHAFRANEYPPGRPDLRPLAPASRLPRNNRVTMSDTAEVEDELNQTYVRPVEISTHQRPKNNQQSESFLSEHKADVTPAQNLPADRHSFSVWLTQLPAQRQQEHSIELLICWMAYADNRYDPALKKTIFQMKDPDAHSLIKRWVFKNDATAFADAVKYLQLNTDSEQRKQVIDLLMALLINENALTPNQNVLLRFLADAFGIGRAELETRYRQAFGQTMPMTPRPDKSNWWKTLNIEQRLRWNVHAIARLPEQLRFRILLGQPLSGTLDLQSEYRSYTLAMKRCHNERVSKLGDTERMLLSTKRQKFVVAHNALLEPVQ